jgi:hypothetical protein
MNFSLPERSRTMELLLAVPPFYHCPTDRHSEHTRAHSSNNCSLGLINGCHYPFSRSIIHIMLQVVQGEPKLTNVRDDVPTQSRVLGVFALSLVVYHLNWKVILTHPVSVLGMQLATHSLGVGDLTQRLDQTDCAIVSR